MQQKNNYIEDVYAVTRMIPAGRVCTYGLIANYLALGSARMVGWALNQSFTNEAVPAHRVVNRKGELSGRVHFSPPSRMQELLEAEGIIIENEMVKDFKKIIWDPATELNF